MYIIGSLEYKYGFKMMVDPLKSYLMPLPVAGGLELMIFKVPSKPKNFKIQFYKEFGT